MTRFLRLLPTAALLLTAELSAGGNNTFTGFQVGILGGGQVGRMESHAPKMAPNAVIAPTGFQAGLHLGYGMNFGGLFVSFDAGILKDWSSDNIVTDSLDGYRNAVKARKLYTFFVGPRIGMQFGNALPFLRLGYTQARYSMTNDWVGINPGTTPLGRDKASETPKGFLLGAGIDFSLCSSMIIGLSYDYSFLGGYKKIKWKDVSTGAIDTEKMKFKSHSILLKIAYKI